MPVSRTFLQSNEGVETVHAKSGYKSSRKTYLFRPSGVITVFIISYPQETGEPQGNASIFNLRKQPWVPETGGKCSTVTYKSLSCRVYGTQTQVGSQNLPNDFRFEPYVRFGASDFDVTTRFSQFERLQCIVMCLEHFFTEASTDLAYCLVFFRIGIVASKEEGAIYICSLALSVVPANNNQV